MINTIKKYAAIVLAFTTGLGFYGLGLLIAGLVLMLIFGWTAIGAGFIGAFVFKNYQAIVDYFKSFI